MVINENRSVVLNGHNAKAGPANASLARKRKQSRGEEVLIRPFKQSDAEGIYDLCCETGFLGEPVDPLFCDRELFADLFTRPYLEYEPEWGLVAEANQRVVGYLLGSVSSYFAWLQLWAGFQTTSKMVLRLATGRYDRHPRSRRFVKWLLTSGLREQPSHPRNAAHLHFDIEAPYRGRGIAHQMWNTFEQKLRQAGINRCYGAFFSHSKRRPESVYARYGFKIFDRRRTTLFQPEISEIVEVVCVSKDL